MSDKIVIKPPTDAAREAWDRMFTKPCPDCIGHPGAAYLPVDLEDRGEACKTCKGTGRVRK